MNNKLVKTLLISTCLSIISLQSFAAEDALSGGSVITYDKTYFKNFSPVTLLDMLQAVPGVPEILNENRQQSRRGQRGFGSGGDQILVDGKRLSGKANNINDTLSLVSALQIDRIELIRGASSGLDVQSQGVVINIIMLEGVSKSTTFWKIKGEYSGGHDVVPEFLISHSGSMESLDYSLSYERKDNDFFFDTIEEFYNPDGTYKALQVITGGFGREANKFSSSLTYAFEDGSSLRLNGLYEPNNNGGQETRTKTSNALNPVLWDTARDFGKWEIGGDYSRNMGVLGKLKTLFVLNRNTVDAIVHRFKGTGDEKFEYARNETGAKRTEKIFRASLTKGISDGQSLEVGGEAAINTFDKKFGSYNRDIAADTLLIGNSDNVEIQENRYEVFVNHSYNISSNMVLQSSLTTEFSKIIADNIFVNGDISRRDTSFTYLKPRVNFRYDYSDRDQIRILAEKKVSQLDFNNFVTRFSQQEQIFKFGNTSIRPEQTWDFSFVYEHRLPNDNGSFEGKVFYRTYKDHITTVDFTKYVDLGFNPISADAFFALPHSQALQDYVDDTGESYSAKSGNIGSAKAYGVNLKSSLRLGFVGVPSATLSIGYTYEKKRATDQFTMLERNFDRHSNHRLDINFRHDITEYKFTYGFEIRARSDSARHYISYYWPNRPAANIKIFAEKTIFSDYKVRFEGAGLTRNRGASTYYNYTDHIRFGDLFERQEKQSKRPVELRLSLQGTF